MRIGIGVQDVSPVEDQSFESSYTPPTWVLQLWHGKGTESPTEDIFDDLDDDYTENVPETMDEIQMTIN